jgi:spermidine synthase
VKRRRASKDSSRAAPAAVEGRAFALLLALFWGSGCAALIYEVVWLQMLELVLGSSAVSIGVLLGTFMGGMCLGSLALARFVPRERQSLRVYAYLELGIGASGLLMLGAIPLVRFLYVALVDVGFTGLLPRCLFAALCLLPPTMMMGAALPAISRCIDMTPRGISRLGILYGSNTLGAVFGCLLAGFYLLRLYDMRTATFVAVAMNAVVAAGALALARARPGGLLEGGDNREVVESSTPATHTTPIYVAVGLSGTAALGAEVIWTRLFGLLLGGTTYTFSIILSVFLIGIGLGSTAGSLLARGSRDPRRLFGFAQLAAIAAVGWTSWNITSSLPYWPVNPALAATPWFEFQLDFVRSLWAILPAAFLWGASFPLALAILGSAGTDAAVVVGRVYAANTVGAIVGALGTSVVLIAAVGTRNCARVLMALSALAAAAALFPALFPVRGGSRWTARDVAWASGIFLAAFLVGDQVAEVPSLLVAHGRYSAFERNTQETFLYVGEGMNSSPAVSRDVKGVLSYYNAGKIQASSLPQDMRLQRMLGHLTTLVPERPSSVLVIACGAGVTAGAASIDPRVDRLTIAEIEPLVPRVVAPYFREYNYDVVRNPKVRVVVDDARHFLTTTKDKFDAITSDPFDPWVKGAANLYTVEFWELAKQHLNPGGVVTVFVQLYASGTQAVKSEVATFFEAFPNGTVWDNTVRGEGYDVVLLGQAQQTPIDVDAMDRRLRSPEYAEVTRSLRQIGLDSALALLSTYGGQGPDLQPWLSDAEVNRDDNLRLQFLAGLGLNIDQRAETYRGMLAFRHYPSQQFIGSPASLGELRAAITARAH